MTKALSGIFLLLWLSLLVPGGGPSDVCLSSPISVVCPTCPVPLRCYTPEDWLDFFLPGWNGGL